MFLIRCPLTGTDELVSVQSVVAVANLATHIELTVRCPHGHLHVHRTGRRRQQARQDAARQARELVLA